MIIIFPPTIDWGWMTQRPQQIMKQFALDGHNVYFCNRTQKKGKIITDISPNLHLVNNNQAFIRQFIPRLKKHGQIIVWVTWPRLHPYLDQYFPDFIVYDFVDDFPEWSVDVPYMVKKSNLVLTTSQMIQQHMEQYYPRKRSYFIPNGCDFEHFQQFNESPPEKPEEYKEHQGPIIGYVGAWAPWIDEDLIKEIANAFPQAMISLIGAEFRRKYNLSLPNAIFHGHKPYESLPQYLYYCDVCLIPFKINRTTLATNPIKMYEYLAAGKPVVSTDLPEVRNVPYVYIGKDSTSFIQKIEILLAKEIDLNQQELNDWLYSHSWKKRYQDIKQILRENRILK
ncbi:glycosyltransferase [Tepidibacillus sp. LV47]|uniref:glycosyltransferase n=1 Tax=Tepidibacillus sp. LV47 TaxID=3398228 RepID=UPI003AB0ED0D